MEEITFNKYYLRVNECEFGFVVDGIHEITSQDIEITNEDYNKFFEMQSQGKQFRIKDVNMPYFEGIGLFDIVEEYVPVVEETPQVPTQEERLLALEEAVLMML